MYIATLVSPFNTSASPCCSVSKHFLGDLDEEGWLEVLHCLWINCTG